MLTFWPSQVLDPSHRLQINAIGHHTHEFRAIVRASSCLLCTCLIPEEVMVLYQCWILGNAPLHDQLHPQHIANSSYWEGNSLK